MPCKQPELNTLIPRNFPHPYALASRWTVGRGGRGDQTKIIFSPPAVCFPLHSTSHSDFLSLQIAWEGMAMGKWQVELSFSAWWISSFLDCWPVSDGFTACW